MPDSFPLLQEANAWLDELDPLRPSAPGQRRQFARHPCRLELRLTLARHGEIVQTWALSRDLSAGGLACILREKLPLSTPLWIDLPLRAGGQLEVTGLVMRRDDLKGGWYLVGVILDKQIDPASHIEPTR